MTERKMFTHRSIPRSIPKSIPKFIRPTTRREEFAYKFFDKKQTNIHRVYTYEGDMDSINNFISPDIPSIAKHCIQDNRIFRVRILKRKELSYASGLGCEGYPWYKITIEVLDEVFPTGEFADRFYIYFSLKDGKLHRDGGRPALMWKLKGIGVVKKYYRNGKEYKTEYPTI